MSSFTDASSTTASIIRSAGRELVDGGNPREHLIWISAALLGEPVEALAHRRHAAFRRAGRGVVQRDAAAGGGHDLRDAATHLAGADDKNVLEVHRARG